MLDSHEGNVCLPTKRVCLHSPHLLTTPTLSPHLCRPQCGCQCTQCCGNGTCTNLSSGICDTTQGFICNSYNNSNCGIQFSTTPQAVWCEIPVPSSWPPVMKVRRVWGSS